MTDVEKKILDALVQEYGVDKIVETLNEMKCTTHDAIRTDKHVDYKPHEHVIECVGVHDCITCIHYKKTFNETPCTHCCESGKCYWEAK